MPINMQGMKPLPPGCKTLSAAATEFIPQDFRIYGELNRIKASTAVQLTQKAIKALNDAPEEFYEVIVPLMSELQKNIWSQNTLKSVVHEIFDKSVNYSQFRYSGARMCQYLSQHLKLRHECGSFLEELIDRCLKEHDAVLIGGGYQSLPHLTGFTFFMGELLVKMNVEEIRKTFPVRLEDLLMTLISNQSSAALRCVIQSLKLTGAILDELVPQAEELYLEISSFVDNPRIPENIQTQIKGLFELRSRGWEKNTTESQGNVDLDESEQEDSLLYDELERELWHDEPLYCDMNGYLNEDIEAMENLKLNDNNGDIDESSHIEKVEYLLNDQPMDPETAQAFESFIQQLPQDQGHDKLQMAVPFYQSDPQWVMDSQWPVDGWQETTVPYANNTSANFGVPSMPDFYGGYQNYDVYPCQENSDSNLYQLQPLVQPVIPVTGQQPPLVHQPIGYAQPIPPPGGSEADMFATPVVVTTALQYVPSSTNGTLNGPLPPYHHPSFGR